MSMTIPDVKAARIATLQFRQAAFELLYVATVNNDAANIALAKQQLASTVVRDDTLNNIEGIINTIVQLGG